MSPDASTPDLTLRSTLTGMALGAILSVCNIYAGLRIGFTFNMSITSALLGFGLWRAVTAVTGVRPFGIRENAMNQTTASAAGAIAGAGLVAPIPAYTMLTGKVLGYGALVAWTLTVSALGVIVALAVRRQLIVRDALPFPNGVATHETLTRMYEAGHDAVLRVRALVGTAVLSGGWKAIVEAVGLKPVGLPGAVTLSTPKGPLALSLGQLGWAIDPSLLLIGGGMLIGPRASLSLGFGGLVAWAIVAPALLGSGLIGLGANRSLGPVGEWLLWPGVGMMVSASLTSLALSLPALIKKGASTADDDGTDDRPPLGAPAPGSAADAATDERGAPPPQPFPWRGFAVALTLTSVASVVGQVALFEIPVVAAILAVFLTFGLALVAGRVSGETGITPIGAMGKVTQLTFGVVAPGSATTNLMAANVTGGAASQCGDMLHDLKTGAMLRLPAGRQAMAQGAGIVAGAFAGCLAYIALIPDPAAMLGTPEWPAPAVVTWKNVAEVLRDGMSALPAGAIPALIGGAAVGVALPILERVLPRPVQAIVPSAASVGLAFVLPAYYAVSIAFGGAVCWGLRRWAPRWSGRFLVAVASGLIAGESLAGVAVALLRMIQGAG